MEKFNVDFYATYMHRTLFSISIHVNSSKNYKSNNMISIVAFVVSLYPSVVSWLECVCFCIGAYVCLFIHTG